MANDLNAAAKALVVQEGWLLDQRNWDEWLALYLDSAEYWIPCWIDEYTMTSDPLREISLIYYSTRAGLEDRVFRLRTKRSLASTPLPRTCHMVQPVNVTPIGEGELQVDSNWVTHNYNHETTHTFFGQQQHVLRVTDGKLKIAKRKVSLANDIIPNILDIYSV